MTLFDETLKDRIEAPFASTGSAIKERQALRNDLEKEIAEFLARGGRINEGPITGPKNEKDLFMPGQGSLEDFPPDKRRKTQKAKSGHENIETNNLKGGGKTHRVVICGMGYGAYSDINEAIERRDQVRALLKMRPAED